ncbi:hypothetical protein CEXT_786251 [Caerostris extrusa]|uniref:Uncharacterized protein n=1 Tax=Caerostris extrusa TaxID=172846 RepID=A0AAV4M4Q7_CAEEX|nr:hypothetical protein CEXT_786251 [Caerostris extrusa]
MDDPLKKQQDGLRKFLALRDNQKLTHSSKRVCSFSSAPSSLVHPLHTLSPPNEKILIPPTHVNSLIEIDGFPNCAARDAERKTPRSLFERFPTNQPTESDQVLTFTGQNKFERKELCLINQS